MESTVEESLFSSYVRAWVWSLKCSWRPLNSEPFLPPSSRQAMVTMQGVAEASPIRRSFIYNAEFRKDFTSLQVDILMWCSPLNKIIDHRQAHEILIKLWILLFVFLFIHFRGRLLRFSRARFNCCSSLLFHLTALYRVQRFFLAERVRTPSDFRRE